MCKCFILLFFFTALGGILLFAADMKIYFSKSKNSSGRLFISLNIFWCFYLMSKRVYIYICTYVLKFFQWLHPNSSGCLGVDFAWWYFNANDINWNYTLFMNFLIEFFFLEFLDTKFLYFLLKKFTWIFVCFNLCECSVNYLIKIKKENI